MKENIYEESTVSATINSTQQQQGAGNSGKNKRCRSNNSSMLSRTLTSSSSSSDISADDQESRSQSPDLRALDSNEDDSIEKDTHDLLENDDEDDDDVDVDDELRPAKTRKLDYYSATSHKASNSCVSSSSRLMQQHSTPVLRLPSHSSDLLEQQTSQFNSMNSDINLIADQFKLYSQLPAAAAAAAFGSNLMMPSPKLYTQNMKQQQMQFMSPLMHEQQAFQSLNTNNSANNAMKPISICAVCGDRASGKHYGVLSCDGCRGFFKRSIRGNMDYVCKENNKCIIDVSRRNQCQSCRLKKCLEVKMNKDAVQHQRPPRSYQIRRDDSIAQQQQQQQQQTASSNQKLYPANKITNANSNNNELNSSTKLANQPMINSANLYNRFASYNLSPMMSKTRDQCDISPASSASPCSSTSSSNNNTTNLNPLAAWNHHLQFNSEFIMNSLATAAAAAYPFAGSSPICGNNFQLMQQLNNSKLAFNSAFKNVNSPFSLKNTSVNRSLANSSSASSGYSTSDDNNDSIKTENDSKESEITSEKSFEPLAGSFKMTNSSSSSNNASLAHIMNWIKTEPSSENFNELTSRIMCSALKWTKTQRNFLNLPFGDQAVLLNDALSELFVLQMAENKSSLSDVMFLAEHEENDEKRKQVQSFQMILQKFAAFKVDLMEFYLLKSIVLFKADLKEVQERAVVESIQEECFNTLYNYTKLNYPNTTRFGRLVLLYTEIRKNTNKLIDDSFLKSVLGKSDVADLLIDSK